MSLKSLHTKYLPALTTCVRFHNLPARLRTSLAFACCLLVGQCSNNYLLIASVFSRVHEILKVFELMVKPRASIVLSQSVLFWREDLLSARGPKLE